MNRTPTEFSGRKLKSEVQPRNFTLQILHYEKEPMNRNQLLYIKNSLNHFLPKPSSLKDSNSNGYFLTSSSNFVHEKLSDSIELSLPREQVFLKAQNALQI
jgi:hypothetical protein